MITVKEVKSLGTEVIERDYTDDELLETFGDDEFNVVAPLVRRAQKAEAEVEKLRGAIRQYGLTVMQTSGEWSLHDVSEVGRIEEEKTLAVVNRNIELEVEVEQLRRIVDSYSAINKSLGNYS